MLLSDNNISTCMGEAEKLFFKTFKVAYPTLTTRLIQDLFKSFWLPLVTP